jgi:hypothetical protein
MCLRRLLNAYYKVMMLLLYANMSLIHSPTLIKTWIHPWRGGSQSSYTMHSRSTCLLIYQYSHSIYVDILTLSLVIGNICSRQVSISRRSTKMGNIQVNTESTEVMMTSIGNSSKNCMTFMRNQRTCYFASTNPSRLVI